MKLFLLVRLMSAMLLASDDDACGRVRSGEYSFEPLKIAESSMNSVSHGMNLEADVYSFTVSADSVHAYMPYVGVIENSLPSMYRNAIEIDSKIENCVLKQKNGRLIVRFEAVSGLTKERFRMTLTVMDNGSADLDVTSAKRERISYLGRIR